MFPCPNCADTLGVIDRDRRLHRSKILVEPLSGLFFINIIYFLIFLMPLKIPPVRATMDQAIPLLLIEVVFLVALLSLGVLSWRSTHGIRLEVVWLRPCYRNCGSAIVIDGSQFCPRCRASVLTEAEIVPRRTLGSTWTRRNSKDRSPLHMRD